jgi:thiosulfate/3-mercaptopyruvate sulfurtransferase
MTNRYRFPEAIVSTEWLAAHLDDSGLEVFECTTYLNYLSEGQGAPYEVESGRQDYDAGHIAGAGFLDIQGELSDASSPKHLRFTMLPPEQLAEAFGRQGIGDDSRVVLYCRGVAKWATRVWWMLRAIGFDTAAVLDGGWEKWHREGRPVSTDSTALAPATLTPRPRSQCFVAKEIVQNAIDDAGTCVINALDADLHRGENPRYGRRGRIPGSVNVPSVSLVDPDTNTFLPADAAAQKFDEVGADPSQKTIVYCGGGIAATLDAFLLHQLGYEDISVYDASISEWARDESLPMETD